MTEPQQGGCQCGDIRYEITGAPLELFICHCTECRKQSASAFGISVIMRSADFRLLSGRPRKWSRPTDSGNTLDCFFCGTCGSRVFHGDPATRETVSVKGGSLDTPPDLDKAVHIWTGSKLSSVIVPENAEQFPGEPE